MKEIKEGTMFNRRHLTAASAALLLAACAGTTPAPAPPGPPNNTTTIKQYLALIGSGLATLLIALETIPNAKVPDDVIQKVAAYLAIIEADAAQIATALTPSPALLQAIAAALNAIIPLVTPFFPYAPAIGAAIDAALALLAIVLSMAGVPTTTAKLRASLMSQQEAVALLTLYSQKGIK